MFIVICTMAPKPSNSNTYKDGIKLDLERLKTNEIPKKKQIYLTKINIKTLSSLIGILSEDVKLYVKLLTANRYYALNDRTINFLSQGEVDMSATTAEFGSAPASKSVSDADVVDLVDSETEVVIFVVDENKTRAGGAFFQILKCNII